MTAAAYDFVPNSEGRPFIEQGANFTQTLRRKTEDGQLINLTGYTARMQIRATQAAPAFLLELTTENNRITIDGPNALITLKLNATETADIDWSKGVYDLELITPAGDVERILQGNVVISKEVTR